MADKRNLNMDTILRTASELVEQNGFDRLNIGSLAAALGVKPPSLYNHIRGINELRQELLGLVLRRVGQAVQRAAVGRSEEKALRDIAAAYRRFAKEHPELYRVFVSAPTLDDGNSLETVADTLRQVLSVFGLEASEEINFIRLFHAGLHGFVSLENAGFFRLEADIDKSFERLVDSQIATLHTIGGSINERN